MMAVLLLLLFILLSTLTDMDNKKSASEAYAVEFINAVAPLVVGSVGAKVSHDSQQSVK